MPQPHEFHDDETLSGDILMDGGENDFLGTPSEANNRFDASTLRKTGSGFVQEVLAYPGIESIVRVIGMAIGVMLIVSGFFDSIWIFTPSKILPGVHTACYGLLFILAELRWPFLLRQAAFLATYRGRAFIYVFVATGTSGDWALLTSLIVGSLGVLNFLLGMTGTSPTDSKAKTSTF